MKKGTLPHEIEKWAILVGRFISSFNEIELSTIKLWELYFGERKRPDKFSYRVDCLINGINEGIYSIENKQGIIKALKKAKKLSRKRNIIAHNPVQVQLWKHKASDDYKIIWAISSDKSEEILEKDMPNLTEQANEIATDLFMYIGEISKLKFSI